MKKVLIITYYWPPSGGGGVQRWVKFVKYLPGFNIEPIVLTVDSEYASYALIDETLYRDVDARLMVIKTKSFEPLNLYKKISPNKEIPYGGFANEANPGIFQKISRFIRGNFTIPDARIGWNKYAFAKAKEIIELHNIDTVITSSPPHSTQLIGLRLKQELGINWIADLRDPWTDIYYYKKMYHTSLAKKIDLRMEYDVIKNADKVIVVSNSIKNMFSGKTEESSAEKIHVIPNGFDNSEFVDLKAKANTKFTISYTGTIADNYNIDGFLEALNEFTKGEFEKPVHINFVGHVSEKYRKKIESSSLVNVCSIINHVNHDESISFLSNSDLLFLSIPNVPQNEGILTGKLFEYLASRKPILAVGPVNGDAAEIINECAAGKMFHYSDVGGMLDYLKEVYQMKKNGFVRLSGTKYLKYTRENLTKQLARLIK